QFQAACPTVPRRTWPRPGLPRRRGKSGAPGRAARYLSSAVARGRSRSRRRACRPPGERGRGEEHQQAVDRRRNRHRRVAQHAERDEEDRKSTRLNSSHVKISYAVFCLKKKKTRKQ